MSAYCLNECFEGQDLLGICHGKFTCLILFSFIAFKEVETTVSSSFICRF